MVRCVFLLSVVDSQYQKQLLRDSVSGKQWRSKDGKRKITDREMVDLSSQLQGWTKSVYTFGCAFIHLSSFHDYANRDPLDSLTPEDRRSLAYYLAYYHGFKMDQATRFRDIEIVFPAVFEKISANLECCIKDLEDGTSLGS